MVVHLLQTFINSNEFKTPWQKLILNNSAITFANALQQLHWLPIKQRIHFKIATVTYRILQTGLPAYLSPFINLNTPLRTLQSALHNFLHVPFTSTLSVAMPLDMLLYSLEFHPIQHQTFTFYWFL